MKTESVVLNDGVIMVSAPPAGDPVSARHCFSFNFPHCHGFVVQTHVQNVFIHKVVLSVAIKGHFIGRETPRLLRLYLFYFYIHMDSTYLV